jgi:adenylate kinase
LVRSKEVNTTGIGKRFVLLGAPGVGKGTQARRLKEFFQIAHISTGDILRDAIRDRIDLGNKVEDHMEKGELIPDDLMVNLVEKRLHEDDCQNGFLLDGFPRTVIQAKRLDELLQKMRLSLDRVISIEIPDEEIISRLSKRLICNQCGYVVVPPDRLEEGDRCPKCEGVVSRREDDKPETIRNRLKVYKERTRSLIEYYKDQNLFVRVDGMGTVDEVYQRILDVLGVILKES